MIELSLTRDRYPAWYRVIVPEYADTPRSGMGAALAALSGQAQKLGMGY